MSYNNSSGGCGAILFGLLVLLIIAAKALLYLIGIGVAVALIVLLIKSIRENKTYIKAQWKQILLIVGGIGLFILCVWVVTRCGSKSVAPQSNEIQKSADSVKVEPIDTAQIIADQRKDSIFEGNIFAGLRFGISKSEYERLIRKFKREYDNKIVFPDGKGNVLSYGVSWFEPKFYRGKLYEVEVKIDNYHAYYELEPVFERKYGITKFNHWEWQNAEIELSSRSPYSESVYDPTSGTGARYDIPKPGYTTIRYKNLILYNLERKEQMRNDSIREAKERAAAERCRQRERERANRYKDNI